MSTDSLDVCEIVQLETLEEFEELVEELRSYRPIWRGQENAEWGLETTLERFLKAEKIEKSDSFPFIAYYGNLVQVAHFIGNFSGLSLDIQNDIGEHFIPIYNIRDAQKYWNDFVLLRHHGFPSFYLDWTQSPWIALYFAFEQANECDRAIFVQTGNIEVIRPGVPNVYYQSKGFWSTATRHSMQQCWLSFAREVKETEEVISNKQGHMIKQKADYIIPIERGIIESGLSGEFKKIILPAKIRKIVLKKLSEYNVNHFTLFGNPESVLRTAALNSFVIKHLTL